MSSSRFVISTFLVALAAIAGCSTSTGDAKEDIGTDQSELTLSGVRYLGKIQNGETRSGYYYTPPSYRAYGFDAKGGDQVTVDITSVNGDAVGYITDADYNVLAYNDDASGTTFDAKVQYNVPTGQPLRSYRVVFRDYDMLAATFNVTLSICSFGPTCTYDGKGYSAGEAFSANDGCNTCSCNANGTVSCSKLKCTCDPQNEPWRTYLATPQQCISIRYACPMNQVPFSNACGCGCEKTTSVH
jgi:hypothetical protein